MNANRARHAYLIIAHNNFEQLQTLITLLDDERNDIYLHIDKKSGEVPRFHTVRSRLTCIDRMKVYWGGHSQIQCELALMRAAAPGHYGYYHLLSGIDLPLKTQDQIHAFFRENDGKEFIDFDPQANEERSFLLRTQYYHPLQNIAGSSPRFFSRVLRVLNWGAMYVQKFLHITRKEIIPLYKGANWFSITDEMVGYVLDNQEVIRKQFYYTYCADEVFLQSLAMQSPRREHIVCDALRAVDWERGDPYVYRAEDVPALLASDRLWGRKFVQTIDQAAIDLVVQGLTGKA